MSPNIAQQERKGSGRPSAVHLANALEVLRSELEEELKGEERGHALALLRLELGYAIDQARAWAARRGLSFNFPKPNPDCGVPECLILLRSVADVLRELASRAPMGVMNDNGWLDDDER